MTSKALPVQIRIAPRAAANSYPVQTVIGSTGASSELVLPVQLIDRLAALLANGVAQPVRDPEALGRVLGRALLGPELRELLLGAARAAAERNAYLQLQIIVGAAELALLPWEWMALGAEEPWRPALNPHYTVVRCIAEAKPAPPAPLDGPLQVLAATPHSLDVQQEELRAALGPVVRAGQVDLHLLRDVTPSALRAALGQGRTHLLHFVVPEDMQPTSRRLAQALSATPELRLVTLVGAPHGVVTLDGVLPQIAIGMLEEGVPAVLALGAGMVSAERAELAAECYERLANGDSVDRAVSAARRALAQRSERAAWGVPQLWMARGGQHLFRPAAPR